MPAMAGDGLGARASSSEGGPQSLSWMTRTSLFIYTACTHVYTGRKLELGARNWTQVLMWHSVVSTARLKAYSRMLDLKAQNAMGGGRRNQWQKKKGCESTWRRSWRASDATLRTKVLWEGLWCSLSWLFGISASNTVVSRFNSQLCFWFQLPSDTQLWK